MTQGGEVAPWQGWSSRGVQQRGAADLKQRGVPGSGGSDADERDGRAGSKKIRLPAPGSR